MRVSFVSAAHCMIEHASEIIIEKVATKPE